MQKINDVNPCEENVHESGNEALHFISFTHPAEMKSSSSIKGIRRHAMKEIGRKRRRSKRPLLLDLMLDTQEMYNQSLPAGQNSPKSWWLGAGRMDPFIKYPINLGAGERELVALIFDSQVHTQLALRDAWFAVGLEDPASFLLVLANSALNMDSLRNGGRDPIETPASLQYQTLAISSTNSKLNRVGGALTDETIGTVTGLMCYNIILGDYNRWLMHWKGLISMIQITGGFGRIDRNEKLRLTINWVEIQGALAQDLEPVFPIPSQWLQYAHPATSAGQALLAHKVINSWTTNMPENPEWIRIYHDLLFFSQQTSFDAQSMGQVRPPYFGAWTNAIIHRLLSFRPLKKGISYGNIIEEVCRIASLLYLIPLWRKFGVFPVRSAYLVGKLRVTLSSYSIHWAEELETLHMWILYMGCVEASGDNLEWFVHETNSWFHRYGLQSWDVLQARVMSILWIDNVFEVVGKRVARILDPR